jgi:hypothetical protein
MGLGLNVGSEANTDAGHRNIAFRGNGWLARAGFSDSAKHTRRHNGEK